MLQYSTHHTKKWLEIMNISIFTIYGESQRRKSVFSKIKIYSVFLFFEINFLCTCKYCVLCSRISYGGHCWSTLRLHIATYRVYIQILCTTYLVPNLFAVYCCILLNSIFRHIEISCYDNKKLPLVFC